MTEEMNVEATTEAPTETTETSTEQQGFTIPDEYKEKAYTKSLVGDDGKLDMNRIFAKLDFSQEQLGKKGLPKGNDPEEWKSFVEQFKENDNVKNMFSKTAPEKYDFTDIEMEGLNEEPINKFMEISKELNMDNDTAKGFLSKWLEYEQSNVAKKTEQRGEEFTKSIQSKYGDNWQQELAPVSEFLSKFVDKETREQLTNLNNDKHILLVLDAAKQMMTNAPKPDSAPNQQSGANLSEEDIREKMNEYRRKSMKNGSDVTSKKNFERYQDMLINKISQK